jgi:hypothetical protein
MAQAWRDVSAAQQNAVSKTWINFKNTQVYASLSELRQTFGNRSA